MTHRVAVFGGSFNPPHVAHVMAAVYVLSTGDIDQFLVVPCFIHPFAKALAPFEQRLQMCQLAFGWLPNVSISPIEQQLGGESRTLRTLQELSRQHPDWALRLVVGADVLTDAPRWHGFDQIERIAPPIVLGRIGVNESAGLPEVFPNISSTRVREALGAGDIEAVRALVPREVLAYVQHNRLYASRP